jgi:hypothetical protein
MNIKTMRKLLGWCTLINFAGLLYWWGVIVFFGDAVFELHRNLLQIQISRPVFEVTNYAGMIFYKLLVMVFNFVPYLVLRFAFPAAR